MGMTWGDGNAGDRKGEGNIKCAFFLEELIEKN